MSVDVEHLHRESCQLDTASLKDITKADKDRLVAVLAAASDELKSLRAENAELREALERANVERRDLLADLAANEPQDDSDLWEFRWDER